MRVFHSFLVSTYQCEFTQSISDNNEILEKKKNTKEDRLYTLHGKKKAQGILLEVNGQKALATFEGEKIIGYTTLDELNKEFYNRDLPKYDLKF